MSIENIVRDIGGNEKKLTKLGKLMPEALKEVCKDIGNIENMAKWYYRSAREYELLDNQKVPFWNLMKYWRVNRKRKS